VLSICRNGNISQKVEGVRMGYHAYKLLLVVAAMMSVSNGALAQDLECNIKIYKDVRYDLIELDTNLFFLNWVSSVAANGATRKLGMYLPFYLGPPPALQNISLKIQASTEVATGKFISEAIQESLYVISPDVYPPFSTRTGVIPFTSPSTAIFIARDAAIHKRPDYSSLFNSSIDGVVTAITEKKSIEEVAHTAAFEAYRTVHALSNDTKARVRKSLKCAMFDKIENRDLLLQKIRAPLNLPQYIDVLPEIRDYFESKIAIIEKKL
jgi:hypothetical protein